MSATTYSAPSAYSQPIQQLYQGAQVNLVGVVSGDNWIIIIYLGYVFLVLAAFQLLRRHLIGAAGGHVAVMTGRVVTGYLAGSANPYTLKFALPTADTGRA